MNLAELRIMTCGIELAATHQEGTGLPVIALHGWMDNLASFAVVAQHLKMPLLIPDLAGHGHSDWRTGVAANNLWDDLPEIIGLADHMGWQQFGLLGHSRGAIHAALLAAALPERVTHIGLVEGLCPTTRPASEASLQLTKALKQALTPLNPPKLYASLESMVDARCRADRSLLAASAQLLVARGSRSVEGGFCWRHDPRQQMASPVLLTDEQAESFLPAIEAKVILIQGAQGFLAHDPRLAQRRLLCPQLEHVILQGGHHLHMDVAAVDIGQKLNVFFGEQA